MAQARLQLARRRASRESWKLAFGSAFVQRCLELPLKRPLSTATSCDSSTKTRLHAPRQPGVWSNVGQMEATDRDKQRRTGGRVICVVEAHDDAWKPVAMAVEHAAPDEPLLSAIGP
jgi:hypothetical protein